LHRIVGVTGRGAVLRSLVMCDDAMILCRSMRAHRGAILALHFACGCITQRGYACDEDRECVLDDVDGRCELQGWCSYPDDECPGGWRFESLAKDDLAGRCVDPPTGCDAMPCAAERLVVGDTHSCVIDSEGRLWCWGSNVFGQLGRDSTAPAERCPAPVVGLDAVELASASEHVCARGEDQRLSCWGHNDFQQVDWHGGVADIVRAPLEIAGLESVPAVLDVGPRLSCIASATTVTCWGQLPSGIDQPIEVETDAPVTRLATGTAHACALLADGRVACVGDDTSGQLGDGDPGGSNGLIPTFPIAGAIAIDAGPMYTCALLSDDVVCWGANEAGQCGIAADQAIVATPTSVVNRMAGPYADIVSGGQHSCLRGENGRVQCWGDDASGQLGSTESGPGAHSVVDADGGMLIAMEIGAGARHTCARTTTTAVQCWGDNGSLQLGAPQNQLTRARHTIELGCE
jgi:hypothetical protein